MTTNTSQSLTYLEELTGRKITFSNTIWAIRESEELTQVEMAKRLKISKQYLCDIERGRRAVSPVMAANFAIKLGFLPAQFVQLVLQDEINKSGLSLDVIVHPHSEAA